MNPFADSTSSTNNDNEIPLPWPDLDSPDTDMHPDFDSLFPDIQDTNPNPPDTNIKNDLDEIDTLCRNLFIDNEKKENNTIYLKIAKDLSLQYKNKMKDLTNRLIDLSCEENSNSSIYSALILNSIVSLKTDPNNAEDLLKTILLKMLQNEIDKFETFTDLLIQNHKILANLHSIYNSL